LRPLGLMPRGVSKYLFCVLHPVWGTNCSHDKSKCSVALMAEALNKYNKIVKLGLSCTMCMRIHPQVRPPFSSLDMYALCPHTTSASVWLDVGRPRAADLGGWGGGFQSAVYTGDTADYKVKVLSVYMNLPSARVVAIAARRTKLSCVSDVRRGPMTCLSVRAHDMFKRANMSSMEGN
jgi:hypothetical protein